MEKKLEDTDQTILECKKKNRKRRGGKGGKFSSSKRKQREANGKPWKHVKSGV